MSSLICTSFTAYAEVDIENTSVGEGETSFIEIPYNSEEGVTIKVNVMNGVITIYVSFHLTTPNEAFYDWMIETDGYSDVFLDPDAISRTNDIVYYVYGAIKGAHINNHFTLVAEEGDTKGEV